MTEKLLPQQQLLPVLLWLFEPPPLHLPLSIAEVCPSVKSHHPKASLPRVTLRTLLESPSIVVGDFARPDSPRALHFYKNQSSRCTPPTPHLLKVILDLLSPTRTTHDNT